MMNHFRCLLTRLFGVQWVLLTDHDGEVNCRRVIWMGDKPFAQRMMVRRVALLDGGGIGGAEYVEKWEPAYACGKKRFPCPTPDTQENSDD